MAASNAVVNGYETKYVVFLDVLGWSRLVFSAQDNSRAFAIANDVATALSSVHRAAQQHVADSGWHPASPRFEFFSDTIVVSVVSRDCLLWPESVVLDICKNVARAILQHGMLVRGGVCRGEIWHSSEQRICFGPALLRAYHLESECAVMPRIVLDHDIVDQFRTKLEAANDVSSTKLTYAPRSPLRQDQDGVTFVDYLGPDYVDIDSCPPMARDASEVQRRIASAKGISRRQLVRDDLGERIREKYLWFQAYAETLERELRLHDSPSDEQAS